MQDDDGAENEEIQGHHSCPCYFRTDPALPEATPEYSSQTPVVAGVQSASKLELRIPHPCKCKSHLMYCYLEACFFTISVMTVAPEISKSRSRFSIYIFKRSCNL